MIDVTEAVNSATQYLRKFYPEISNILLEEVEIDATRQQWLITLSFPNNETDTLAPFQLPSRKNKLFQIDAQAGMPVAMKMRQV